jgi:hypothetical protein
MRARYLVEQDGGSAADCTNHQFHDSSLRPPIPPSSTARQRSTNLSHCMSLNHPCFGFRAPAVYREIQRLWCRWKWASHRYLHQLGKWNNRTTDSPTVIDRSSCACGLEALFSFWNCDYPFSSSMLAQAQAQPTSDAHATTPYHSLVVPTWYQVSRYNGHRDKLPTARALLCNTAS